MGHETEPTRLTALRAAVLLLALALLAAACGNGDGGTTAEETATSPTDTATEATEEDTAQATGEPIPVGVAIAQTGNLAVFGEQQQAAMEMAVEQINQTGGVLDGRPLELVIEDSGAEASTGVAAVQRLLAQDPVAVLGMQYSFQVQPVIPIADEAGIPFVIGAQTVELAADQEGSEWFFRVRSDDRFSAESLVELALRELDVERPAINHGTDPVSSSFKDQVVNLLAEEGIEPTTIQAHDLGTQDLTAQMRNTIQADPDSVFLQTFLSESALFARQANELGLEATVLAGPAALFAAYDFELIEPQLIEGWYVSVDSVPNFSEDPVEQQWAEEYQERSGISANEIASSWYGSVILLADAIERAGSTEPQALYDALENTENLTSFKGIELPGFQFTCTVPAHNCYNKRDLVHIVDGEPQVVLTYTRDEQ